MAVTSWKYPSSAASTNPGNAPWTSPTNIYVDDAGYAACVLSSGQQTYELRGQGFGFTSSDVPSGATILGVEVEIEYAGDEDRGATAMYATELFLLNGTLGTNADHIGSDKITTDVALTPALTVGAFGGAADTWGASLTPAIVTGSSFGVGYRAVCTSGTFKNTFVDFIRMRVHYSVPVTHATTGSLTGQIGSVAGSAARFRAFSTTGALTGQIGGVAGTAQHNVPHATSGVLAGQGASVIGASTRFRAFATSGSLTGQIGAVAGTAQHNVPHAATGALAGQGASVAGVSARFRAFATSGVLVAPGAVVAGSALHNVPHATTGALTGPGAAIAATALHAVQLAPVSDVSAGTWLSTAATLYGAVDEKPADDADFIHTSAFGTTVLALQETTDPATDDGFKLHYRAASDNGARSLRVALKQGTTLIAQETRTNIASTPTDYTFAISSASMAAVTDFAALRVELEYVA